MTRAVIFLVALALLSASALSGGLEVGKAGGDFSLKHGDETVTLSGILERDDTKAVVVAIASYTCPYSLRADRELKPLFAPYSERGVRFVAVYPNKHETVEELALYAEKQGFSHTLLRDPDGTVARSFGAEVTPTFFLFDKTGFLKYRGNLKSLAAAMGAVLEGTAVAKSTTPATGCTVKWPEAKVRESPRLGGTYAGPHEEVPPRERQGPEDPPPPGLSKSAQKWIRRLIKSLGSEDPLVVRSATAGLLTFGPAAMPQLRAAHDAAEGAARHNIARTMDQVARGGRPGMAPGRGPAGQRPGGRFRGSFLDRHRERIERTLDLTDEQKQQIAELFHGLKARERELMKMREGGNREEMREGYRQLMIDAQAGLAKILTEKQQAKLEEQRGDFRGPRSGGRRGSGEGRERER